MTYQCPMHPEVKQNHPGNCPKCGMKLTSKDVSNRDENTAKYTPLVIIIGLIFLVAVVSAYHMGFSFMYVITNFMIGFFVVFSGFKLVNIQGFAEGYSMYDLLAQRVYAYGYIYPFIELFFGLAMILHLYPKQVLILEILVMGFSGIGVALKIAKREKFQCACLGTFLKVPLTWVTLIEDFGMVILAFVLLLY